MCENGYIYKIFCKTDELVYYGSTILQVCKRIKQHQSNYKSWKRGGTNFVTSFLIIDTGDWDYITVEKVVYYEPLELRNRERYWIQNNECVNKCIPNNTQKESSKKWYDSNKEYKKEYYEQNEQQIKESQKQYRAQNKEKINEKINCGCGSIVMKCNLSNHKKTKKHLNYLDTQS